MEGLAPRMGVTALSENSGHVRQQHGACLSTEALPLLIEPLAKGAGQQFLLPFLPSPERTIWLSGRLFLERFSLACCGPHGWAEEGAGSWRGPADSGGRLGPSSLLPLETRTQGKESVLQPQRWVLPAQGASGGEAVTAKDGAAAPEISALLLTPSIRLTSEAQGHSLLASKMTLVSDICSVDPGSTQVPF